MQKYNLRNGDVVSGAILTALGTYIVIQASIWPYYEVNGPGPGFFPLWYGILMITLSLGLIVSTARKPKSEGGENIFTIGTRRALLVWLGLVVCLVAMVWLGFNIAFALFTVFIVTYVLGRPLLTGLITGILSAASFYILFAWVLGVQLPTSPWGF
jgi:putative tricarboxylic transport membrane protein